MTIRATAAALISGALFLSGCVSNDPAYQAQQAEQRQRVSADNTEFVTDELGPLVDVCLDVIENGQPVSNEKMTALGFSEVNGLLGKHYKKKRGDSALDRLNFANTLFSAKGNRCVFTIGNFSGYREAFAFVGNSLNFKGNNPAGSSKKGLKYEKGDQVLFLYGYFNGQAGQTVVSITRES